MGSSEVGTWPVAGGRRWRQSRPRKSVAVVGVDGAGKTTLVRELRRRSWPMADVLTLHCPQCHMVPDAPLRDLSQHLEASARVAEMLLSVRLKVAMLYLRMTLHGPIERFLCSVYEPRLVLSDRHPIIDTLVYGGRYRERAIAAGDLDEELEAMRERLEVTRPGAYSAMAEWLAVHTQRVGGETGIGELVGALFSLLDRSIDEQVAEFGFRFETVLPDVVVWLDVEPDEALRRATFRPGGCSELQRDREELAVLRDSYAEVLGSLRQQAGFEVHRLTDPPGSPQQVLDLVLEQIGAAELLAGAGETRR